MLGIEKGFTQNMEKICGVTWRDAVTRTIVPIDLIDGAASGYMPAGKILAEVADDEVPYAESWEVIKMKILCAHKRDDLMKGIRDFDDIKDLIKAGDGIIYTDEEKADLQFALKEFLYIYRQHEPAWTVEEWLRNTRLG